jgi:hypothetical protein
MEPPPDALRTFRRSFYECLHRRSDALFELTDAILTTHDSSPSPVHLSLQPAHRRGWGSFYAALARGRIDAEVLRELLARHPRSQGVAQRPSTPWTLASGPDATRRRAPSGDTTIILPDTQRGSPSLQDGPTSSSHN